MGYQMSLFDFRMEEDGTLLNTREITKGDHKIAQISRSDAIPFIMCIHYARRIPCIQYAFGLFVDNELIGIVTYGQPASHTLCEGVAGKENAHRILELNRLALKPERNGKNLASMLVGNSLKLLPSGMIVVSYADWEGWGHVGYVYQATNWLYTGMTNSRTDKFSEGHSRHYEKDEKRRQYRTAKHRYVFITGRSERRKLMSQLKYDIQPYPKGDDTKYDTENPKPLVGKELPCEIID